MPPVMLIAMARATRPSFVVGLALSAGLGCAGLQPAKEPPPTTELELAYDSGPASERPLLPQASFEWLIKFEPNLPAYQPHRLRLLLAQPGAMRLTLYAADAAGRPGETLRTLERTYTPEQTSNGKDGKWLLEPLFDLSRQTGAMFVGISVPNPGPSAARLWATTVEPGSPPHAFARDAEPGTPLQSTRLATMPMLRLSLVPAAAPPAAPASPATTPATPPTPETAPAPAPAAPVANTPGT